jgi:hypothetical protein
MIFYQILQFLQLRKIVAFYGVLKNKDIYQLSQGSSIIKIFLSFHGVRQLRKISIGFSRALQSPNIFEFFKRFFNYERHLQTFTGFVNYKRYFLSVFMRIINYER